MLVIYYYKTKNMLSVNFRRISLIEKRYGGVKNGMLYIVKTQNVINWQETLSLALG